MNKKWQTILIITSLFWCSAGNATLIYRGGGMVYDTELDITWMQDANYAVTSGYDTDGLINWYDATAWASSLTFGDYTDWRLPTHNASNPRPTSPDATNEIGWLWHQISGGDYINTDTDISPFTNLAWLEGGYEWYWTGTETEDATGAWRISIDCACWDAQDKNNEYFVWLVRSGDVSSIPEPGTLLLLSLGLMWVFWFQRRRLPTS